MREVPGWSHRPSAGLPGSVAMVPAEPALAPVIPSAHYETSLAAVEPVYRWCRAGASLLEGTAPVGAEVAAEKQSSPAKYGRPEGASRREFQNSDGKHPEKD